MALTDANANEKDIIETVDDRNESTPVEQEKILDPVTSQKAQEESFDGVIDLSDTRKKRFNVNRGSGEGGVLLLNTSDMSIINRLDNLYPKLQKLSQDAATKQIAKDETQDERAISRISQTLTKIDMQMRQIIDEIFDSNVSEVCVPNGSMFDPFNGEFRFEHIIDVLTKLYENNLNTEFKKMSDKMKKRTAKYTKKGR